MMKIDSISDLQILIQAARTGSLSAAAKAMGITPGAASAMLKRLESTLAVRLFERSTRTMRLTAEGQTLLEFANRGFDLISDGISQVARNREALSGVVRMTAPSDLVRTTLLPWLNEFMSQHPGIELALNVGDRPVHLLRNEIDVAIRYGELADSDFVARPLAVVRPLVSGSPGYFARYGVPTTPAELQQHNCLIAERNGQPYRLWRFLRDDHWSEVVVRGNRTSDDASLIREWALAGVGIMLKGPFEQREALANNTLVQVLHDWQSGPYPLNAIMPGGRHLPNRIRFLLNFLTEKFSQVTASSS